VLLGHRLAVLLMVLAIGAQVAPRLAPHNAEAEKYHQLARAALAGARIVDQPTTRAVQALVSRAGCLARATLMRRAVLDGVLPVFGGPVHEHEQCAMDDDGVRARRRRCEEVTDGSRRMAVRLAQSVSSRVQRI
jgi:hypothetical protein